MLATQENQNQTEVATFDVKNKKIQGQIHKRSY